MPKRYTLVATFPSRSFSDTVYRVSRDENGALSCNCPGWTRRVDKRTGERTCRHVEQVLAEGISIRHEARIEGLPRGKKVKAGQSSFGKAGGRRLRPGF